MKKYDKQIYSFTKAWINRLMWFFCIWISLTYVLAFMRRDAVAETLSEHVMTGGVVLFAGYMLKAFFETFSEKKNELKERLHNSQNVAQTGDFEPTEAESDGEEV